MSGSEHVAAAVGPRWLQRLVGVPLVSWGALGISVVLHLILWFGFRVRPVTIHPAAYEPPGVMYQPSPDELGSVAALRLATQMLLQDPTLLSLPHPRGFSRSVMDRWMPAEHRPPEWGWRDAALPAPSVGDARRPILPTVPPSALAAASIRPAPARPEEVDVGAPMPGWPAGIVWRFAGPESGLGTVAQPVFDGVPGARPERPARLRVGFDPAGRVRHAVFQVRTSDAAVDEAILDGLRGLRISPRDDDVQGGTRWAVVEVFWPLPPGGAAAGAETPAADESGPTPQESPPSPSASPSSVAGPVVGPRPGGLAP